MEFNKGIAGFFNKQVGKEEKDTFVDLNLSL